MSELPVTEQQNPASSQLDEMPVESVLGLMNNEDQRVAEAIAEALPELGSAVELLVESWCKGGAGSTWAREPAAVSPSWTRRSAPLGVPPDRVQALIAGGPNAFMYPVEGAEDDRSAAVRDLDALHLSPDDAVVGLAASGSTPYVVSAIRHASRTGCATIGIANNADAELCRVARVGIEVITGPEIITGSTRLKAGTAQKLVLNMLSTTAFTRLNKVYGNRMVDLQATNEKLRRRARRIVWETLDVPESEAEELLQSAEGSAKVAVVMGKANISADTARKLLDQARGSVRRALAAADSQLPR